MPWSSFMRRVKSLSIVHETRNHHFGSLNKKLVITHYKYLLDCGHTVSRTRQEGANPMARKFIHCDWCESGEEINNE